MGKSNYYLNPIYEKLFPMNKPIALLGFENIPHFIKNKQYIDCYDLKLNNFEINSDWKINKKYKSIICTRCLYFCKDPIKFFKKCKEYLEKDGEIFVDFGLGHHLTKFKDFKVGWIKNGEHEWEYKEKNYLWSCIWDDSFLKNDQVQLFQKRIQKFCYNDLSLAIKNEVPVLISKSELEELFSNIDISFLALWEDMPQLYIFIKIKS